MGLWQAAWRGLHGGFEQRSVRRIVSHAEPAGGGFLGCWLGVDFVCISIKGFDFHGAVAYGAEQGIESLCTYSRRLSC